MPTSKQIAAVPGARTAKLRLMQAHWAEPRLIAEVTFTEWTSDGSIRHPSFQGLREDKSPKEVVREEQKNLTGGRKRAEIQQARA